MKFFNFFLRDKKKKYSETARINLGHGNQAAWSEEKYETYSREGYLYNVIAHACIDKIAKAAASVPWKAYEVIDGTKKEIDLPFLYRPNPSDSWAAFMTKVISYLIIAGNSFIEKIAPTNGPNKGMPTEIYALRPDRFEILLDSVTGQISKYKFGGESNAEKTWDVDQLTHQADILHLKLFNPLDDIWGTGLVRAAAREIDTSNEAVTWNKSLLEKQGRPGLIFFLKEVLGDNEYDAFKKSIIDSYEGGKNAGKTIIAEGDGDVKPYGWNPTDMDFIQGHIEVIRRICNGFEVPPQLLGIPDASKYANYKEARLSFWEDSIFYYLEYLKGELNNWLFLKGDKRVVSYDLKDTPALATNRARTWEIVEKATHLSVNEKRAMTGQESWGPTGDVILINAGLIPLGLEINMSDKKETQKSISAIIGQGYTEQEALMLLGLK